MSAERPQVTRHLASAILVASALMLSVRPAAAGPQVPASAAAASRTVMKVAVTPKDHLDRAVEYRKKAAAYREEANVHREMILALKKRLPPDTRPGNYEPPELEKLRGHCNGYIKDAEALAARAEKLAEYHEMRAAELSGQ